MVDPYDILNPTNPNSSSWFNLNGYMNPLFSRLKNSHFAITPEMYGAVGDASREIIQKYIENQGSKSPIIRSNSSSILLKH